MTELTNTVVTVKPPLKTAGRWIAMILVVSVLVLPIAWCYGMSAAQQGRWSWAIWLVAIWLGGIALLASLSLGFYGARADEEALILEKAWQPGSRLTIPWADVQGLEVEIKPEPRNRMRYMAQVRIQEEEESQRIECPYDPALGRAIVSRANLELKRAPGGWQSAANDTKDPFTAMKSLGRTEQTWVWSGS
jgi:hypothetical protein